MLLNQWLLARLELPCFGGLGWIGTYKFTSAQRSGLFLDTTVLVIGQSLAVWFLSDSQHPKPCHHPRERAKRDGCKEVMLHQESDQETGAVVREAS